MKKVVYNNKNFEILNGFNFKFSNNEVTFSDITIDFTGYSIADIPYKYQEIKIKEDETVLFTGFVDEIDFSKFHMREEDREMTLTLLSPLALATKRNVSLIGTYSVKDAIQRILQPLIDDGFVIKEMNITDGQITTNYVLETIENCMNNIGFKRNVFWFINEHKEIFVNSIDYMFSMPAVKSISANTQEEGFLGIQPKIENIDYANVLNFKNVRLIYSTKENESFPIMVTESNVLKTGDIVTFTTPIIIDEKYLRSYIEENEDLPGEYFAFNLNMHEQDNPSNTTSINIGIDKTDTAPAGQYNRYVQDSRITFSDNKGEEGRIVLQQDPFFPNLITGFKYNMTLTREIDSIHSDTAIRYTTMRFMYSAEINKMKGVISESGQIEKVVDYNEKWTSLPKLITHARSLMTQNTNTVNQVELVYDEDPLLKVGDIVEINEPSFYIQGKFAVKQIQYRLINEYDKEWTIILKNSDLISTYIDMFRPTEYQEKEEQIDTVVLSEYIEENVYETHEVEVEV